MSNVLTVCLSPAFQETIIFEDFHEDEVNRSREYKITAAGKGVNVSRALLRLGTPSEHLTQLGGSRIPEFLSYCSSYGIPVLYAETDAPVRTCVTVLNKAKGTSTELVEECMPVDKRTEDRLLDIYSQEIARFDAVIVSGNKAAGYSDRVYPEFVRIAKENGKLIILDARGKDLVNSLPYGPDIIKPNLQEFAATFTKRSKLLEGESNEDVKGEVEAIARDIFKEYGTKTVISRGKYDTWVYDGGRLSTVPNIDVPVVNTIGCGDTLTAGLVHALLEGKTLSDAVAFGMRIATERASRTEF